MSMAWYEVVVPESNVSVPALMMQSAPTNDAMGSPQVVGCS